jgi:hypothetical protein
VNKVQSSKDQVQIPSNYEDLAKKQIAVAGEVGVETPVEAFSS